MVVESRALNDDKVSFRSYFGILDNYDVHLKVLYGLLEEYVGYSYGPVIKKKIPFLGLRRKISHCQKLVVAGDGNISHPFPNHYQQNIARG